MLHYVVALIESGHYAAKLYSSSRQFVTVHGEEHSPQGVNSSPAKPTMSSRNLVLEQEERNCRGISSEQSFGAPCATLASANNVALTLCSGSIAGCSSVRDSSSYSLHCGCSIGWPISSAIGIRQLRRCSAIGVERLCRSPCCPIGRDPLLLYH